MKPHPAPQRVLVTYIPISMQKQYVANHHTAVHEKISSGNAKRILKLRQQHA